MRWSRNLHKGRRGQWESARRETRGEARRQKCVLRANRASSKLSSLADTARALMHATPAQQGPASHLKSTLWNWAALGPRKPPPPCRVCPAGWREGGDRQLAECGPRTISTRGLLHNGATGSRGKHAGSAETAEANSACSATLIGQLAPRQSGPQVASTIGPCRSCVTCSIPREESLQEAVHASSSSSIVPTSPCRILVSLGASDELLHNYNYIPAAIISSILCSTGLAEPLQFSFFKCCHVTRSQFLVCAQARRGHGSTRHPRHASELAKRAAPLSSLLASSHLRPCALSPVLLPPASV